MECLRAVRIHVFRRGVLTMANKIVNVCFFGDSVTSNDQNDSGTILQSHDGWQYYVNTNGGGKFYCSSTGQDGNKIQDTYQRVQSMLPVIGQFVDVFSMQLWTWNNTDLVSNYGLIQSDVVAAVNLFTAANKAFFLHILNPPGSNGGWSTNGAYTTAWTNLITWANATYPNLVVNTCAAMQQTGSPFNWNPAYTYDNVHPNEAGSPIMGASALPQIKTILSNYGYLV